MFIKDVYAISPQLTHNGDFERGDFQYHAAAIMHAFEPEYLSFIPAGLLRRMGKAVRMGIGAGIPLIQKHSKTDGIIIGTANGGLEDCVKFLNQIVEYEEGVLTPTNFVQSTPNAVSGQLALMTDNTGYNNTHVNGSLAFENTIMDAALFLEESSEVRSLLIGAVEEISTYNYNIDQLANRYKEEITPNTALIGSNTPGSVCGEGATLFMVSSSPENAVAEIVDTGQIISTSQEEVARAAMRFLERNGISASEVDVVLTGLSGDNRTDHWYHQFTKTVFPARAAQAYKHFCGDYRTSSAFAAYLATKWINGHRLNDLAIEKTPKCIFIYNHFDAIRHGFILIRK